MLDVSEAGLDKVAEWREVENVLSTNTRVEVRLEGGGYDEHEVWDTQ